MNNTAIITGIGGQDGTYLADILLKNNYKVVGLTRNKSTFNYKKLEHLSIHNRILIDEVNLTDYQDLYKVIQKYKPVKIFNFASQSSVALSYEEPKETLEFNILSVINLLECIRNYDHKIKLFQASSSEIYGNSEDLPVDENTLISPKNIYATSKAAVQSIISNYRDIYGIFVSSAIFFNHESILRGDKFVIKKIIRDLVKVKNKTLSSLKVGNIMIKRDFGYAPKYMEAVYKMLNMENPNDFIIASGKSLSIEEIIYYILNKLNLDKSCIEIDENLFRINDIQDMYGDTSKAFKDLQWSYDINFFDIIDELIEFELNN